MPEILTESFCERCGTRYTFESARQHVRLKGVRVFSKGLKNFVLSDSTSMDEAMASARAETDREVTTRQLDAFHQTFSFCMSCRQYTCSNCWNSVEARCLSCAPLPEAEPAEAAFTRLDLAEPMTAAALNGSNGHGAPADGAVDGLAEVASATSTEPAVAAAGPVAAVQPESIGAFEPEAVTPAEPEAVAALEPADVAAEPEAVARLEPDTLAAAEREPVTSTGPEGASAPQPERSAASDRPAVAAPQPEAATHAQPHPGTTPEPGLAVAPVAEPDTAPIAAAAALSAAPAAATPPSRQPADVSKRAAAQTKTLLRRFRPGQNIDAELDAYERDREAALAAAATAAAVQAATTADARAGAPGLAAAAASTQPTQDAEAPPAPPSEDIVVQPTWQRVAPDLSPEPPAAAPSIPAAASAPEPEAPHWPAKPEWPSSKPAAGLPFLGRPAAPDSGVEGLWAASIREVVATPRMPGKPANAVQPCVSCGLSLSATARFCRRCGTPQAG